MATARSQHVSEPFLEPFLRQSFDPAAFLNEALPGLSTVGGSGSRAGAVSLPELSSQTQTLLSQLNAQTSRLLNVLTQLTDDILRSGGRLAYQVELLRGETIGLSETLTESLQQDLARFGIESVLPGGDSLLAGSDSATKSPNVAKPPHQNGIPSSTTPEHLTHLRMLAQVRERLDSVIKVFGDAMQWTIPPSEVSIASSLISVSGPEPGADSQSREAKGREYAERVRREIADLVTGLAGYDAAVARIQALRDLAQVWKGTSEEKARIKFVESLAKLAEDKLKAVQNPSASRQRDASPRKPGQPLRQNGAESSYSLLDRLYLD